MDRAKVEHSVFPADLRSGVKTANGVRATRVEHSIEDGHADTRSDCGGARVKGAEVLGTFPDPESSGGERIHAAGRWSEVGNVRAEGAETPYLESRHYGRQTLAYAYTIFEVVYKLFGMNRI
jgi:hypothetical protein